MGVKAKGLAVDALARLAVERSDVAELLDAADASAAAAHHLLDDVDRIAAAPGSVSTPARTFLIVITP
jgi:hypothetical protein